MTDWFEMEIDTRSKEDSEKLIRSFVRNSVREMQSKGIIESFHFFRYTPEDKVRLRLFGKRKEAEELLTAKIQTWIIEGVVISYRFNDYGLEAQKFGEKGSEMASRLFEIGSRAALDYMDKFPDMIQPIDTTKEFRTPVGTWILIHSLLQNVGHDSTDEMNACLFAIQNRINFLAQIDRTVAIQAADRLVQILTEKKGEFLSTSEVTDQDARALLMNHYSSQLRHWGTLVLAVVGLMITVFSRDAFEILSRMGWIEAVLVFLEAQAVYAFLRMLWYGRKLRWVSLAVPEDLTTSRLNLDKYPWRKYQQATYVYRLDAAVEHLVRGWWYDKDAENLEKERMKGKRCVWARCWAQKRYHKDVGEMLYASHGVKFWVAWTLSIVVSSLLLLRILRCLN